MDGPVYRYDASNSSAVKWPEYWDGKWIVGDFYDADQPRNAVLMDRRRRATAGSRCTRSR